jgi:hypothetical protein
MFDEYLSSGPHLIALVDYDVDCGERKFIDYRNTRIPIAETHCAQRLQGQEFVEDLPFEVIPLISV